MPTRVKIGKETTPNFEIALSHSLLGFPMSDFSSKQKSDPFVHQTKFESERACVASVSVGVGSKESQWTGFFGVFHARKMVREPKRGKRGRKRGRKEGTPSFVFGSRPIFRSGKTPKIPVVGLSLLPNPTETLATQANPDVFVVDLLMCEIFQ